MVSIWQYCCCVMAGYRVCQSDSILGRPGGALFSFFSRRNEFLALGNCGLHWEQPPPAAEWVPPSAVEWVPPSAVEWVPPSFIK